MSKPRTRKTTNWLAQTCRKALRHYRHWRSRSQPPVAAPPDGAGLLFVTGFDKSGTTWMMRMLDTHPEIICRGCGQMFNYFLSGQRFLRAEGGFRLLTTSVSESPWMRASGQVWLDEAAICDAASKLIAASLYRYSSHSVTYVGDKSTVQDIGLILSLYPKARVVTMARDGRDVAVSFAYHFKRRRQSNKFDSSGDLDGKYLDELALAWASYAMHVRQWAADSRVLVMRYEDLLEDHPSCLRQTLDFLEVDSAQQRIEKIVTRTSFEEMSGGRERGNEDPQSFYRKGVAGDWRNHFSEEQRLRFAELAGEGLNALGYQPT